MKSNERIFTRVRNHHGCSSCRTRDVSVWETAYAKSIQDAILGSADHIVETGENITKKDKITASDTIDIEGIKYIVLEERENNQALVMTASSIGNKMFQSCARVDVPTQSTYEGSEIDNYLENDWYNSLSSTMKAAIQTTSIKQASYATATAPDSKQETGYAGQTYNTISRHVFLPSVDELGKVVDLKSPDKVKAFLNGTTILARDSYRGTFYRAEGLSIYSYGLNNIDTNIAVGVRPAFVIDLSKVDYTVAGHTDYK